LKIKKVDLDWGDEAGIKVYLEKFEISDEESVVKNTHDVSKSEDTIHTSSGVYDSRTELVSKARFKRHI
jgi:hypothetical protein